MLKRFNLENFSSFHDEQSLDLTAGRTEVIPEHVVDFPKVKLLKSAVIYGANASGKSNLIKAMDFAKRVLIKGLANVDTHKKHFRLDAKAVHQPSSFEFEIELAGRFFSYGFSSVLKSKEIGEEWLYEIGKKKPELIFSRDQNGIELGKLLMQQSIKSRFEIYQDDMKNQKSQLFLAEIADKELEIAQVEIINQLHHWFENKLIIIYPGDTFGGLNAIAKNNTDIFKKYLGKFDTGVVGVESIDEDFEIALKNLPEQYRESIAKDFVKIDAKEALLRLSGNNSQFLTVYKDDEGELKVRKLGLTHGKNIQKVFDLKDESDGTKRLLDFIPLISKFEQDRTIVIDEFDRSLHPRLTREFFELFYQVTGSKAQLIVTTHESTLLNLELLRRDEIWFVEKSDGDKSALFSLNKFKIRYDSKIDKAYLLGRYGAVPVFRDFDNIDWQD